MIDDDLMDEALKLSGIRTKREAVETALRIMIDLKKQQRVRDYFGKLDWQGDLGKSRSMR